METNIFEVESSGSFRKCFLETKSIFCKNLTSDWILAIYVSTHFKSIFRKNLMYVSTHFESNQTD